MIADCAVPRLELSRLMAEHIPEESSSQQTKPSSKLHRFLLGNRQNGSGQKSAETGWLRPEECMMLKEC